MAQSGPVKAGARTRPKKWLGQHFLVDPGIIRKIITLARFQSSDLVLEIGPGLGALTLPLSRSVRHVVAVEKDAHLSGLLEKKLDRAGVTNVTLVTNDILTWDFQELSRSSSTRIQVIGNLPYNISSPFLEKLVRERAIVSRAILMFQAEVAGRLAASPGVKAYGALTVLVRYHARSKVLLEVSRNAFYPKPKVDSKVLEIDFGHPYPVRAASASGFTKVVRGAFAHRRKTLLNSLMGAFPNHDREEFIGALRECDIDPGRRGETLDMDEFLCLSSALALTNDTSGDK